MEIRPAALSDARAIAEIHVSGWRFAYRGIVPQAHLDGLSVTNRERNWANSISTGQPQILVAVSDGEVIGWVAFDRCRDSDRSDHSGEIWAIYVAPERLGQGVGRDLWLQALDSLRAGGYREVSLWVLAENERACQFYAKAGFAPDAASAKDAEIGGAKLLELRYVRSITA